VIGNGHAGFGRGALEKGRKAPRQRPTSPGWRDLPLAVAAERIARAVAVPFDQRTSPFRGAYYRWSSEGGADILIQANVAEEALPVETSHAYTALVYATGLDDGGYDALARIEGLELLDAEIVLVG
jgi:hypothetical protein